MASSSDDDALLKRFEKNKVCLCSLPMPWYRNPERKQSGITEVELNMLREYDTVEGQ